MYCLPCLEVWRNLCSPSKRVGKAQGVVVGVVALATHGWCEVSCLTVLCLHRCTRCALSSLGGWLLWQEASVQWINCKMNVRLLQGEISCLLLWLPTPKLFLPVLLWHAATDLWKSKTLIVKLPLNWQQTGFTQCSAPRDHFIQHASCFVPFLHLTRQI